MKKFLWLIAVSGICLVQAQSAKEDLRTVSENLQKGNFAIYYDYLLYDSYTTEKPVESQKLSYFVLGKQFASHSKNLHQITTDKVQVVVHDLLKVVVVSNVNKKTKTKGFKMMFDTLFSKFKHIELVEWKGNYKVYKFLFEDKSKNYERAFLTIDMQKKIVKKMVIYYKQSINEHTQHEYKQYKNQPARVEIVCTDYTKSISSNTDELSISKYLTYYSKTYMLTKSYAAYKLVDNTKIKQVLK